MKRIDKITLLLMFFVICLPTFAVDKVSTTDPHPKLLRVMSYNSYYVFDNRKQVEPAKKWIASQTPDIVALQELTSVQPEFLASLGNSWGHQYSSLLKTSGFSVGITSRYPIELVEKVIAGMHHGYLHVKTAGIHVFTVHLSPFKHTVRLGEVKKILEKVQPLIDAKKRVIVMGDFNAFSPHDKTILEASETGLAKMAEVDRSHGHVQNLKGGKFDYEVIGTFYKAGLIDSGRGQLKKVVASRMSIPTGIWTDKETTPKEGQRIDFILTTPQLHKRVSSTKIVTSGIVNKISDHYPVITDFKLTVPKKYFTLDK